MSDMTHKTVPVEPENQYRKKPVVIEAWQVPSDDGQPQDVPLWIVGALASGELVAIPGGGMEVRTLEDGKDGRAKHVADVHDWIIRGIKGELYPCKPDIFAATYEPAEAAPPSPVTELEAMLYEALRAFRDGGPEGGTDFNGWHQSYEEPCRLAREALAAYEAKKETK